MHLLVLSENLNNNTFRDIKLTKSGWLAFSVILCHQVNSAQIKLDFHNNKVEEYYIM